jgi:transcription initiation factor TFIIA large subunit
MLTLQAGSLLSNTPAVDVDSDLDAPHDPESPRPQYLDSSQVITPQSTQKKPKKEIDPLDDAINSDLDDSDIESDIDSEFGEGDDADDAGADKAIILCMYEKVHRTKNKWKCNLKDGVISVRGRDYVFSKANGEFEW